MDGSGLRSFAVAFYGGVLCPAVVSYRLLRILFKVEAETASIIMLFVSLDADTQTMRQSSPIEG